jgi:hypothetical protein
MVSDGLNEGVVGDTSEAGVTSADSADASSRSFVGGEGEGRSCPPGQPVRSWPFVREWEDLLALPLGELASKLVSRDREMVRLGNSSPLYLAEDVDLGDYDARLRLRRAARRDAKRASGASPKDRPD